MILEMRIIESEYNIFIEQRRTYLALAKQTEFVRTHPQYVLRSRGENILFLKSDIKSNSDFRATLTKKIDLTHGKDILLNHITDFFEKNLKNKNEMILQKIAFGDSSFQYSLNKTVEGEIYKWEICVGAKNENKI